MIYIYIYQNLTQLATLRCEKMQLWLVEMLVVLEVEEVVVASSSAKKCRAYGLLVVVVVEISMELPLLGNVQILWMFGLLVGAKSWPENGRKQVCKSELDGLAYLSKGR